MPTTSPAYYPSVTLPVKWQRFACLVIVPLMWLAGALYGQQNKSAIAPMKPCEWEIEVASSWWIPAGTQVDFETGSANTQCDSLIVRLNARNTGKGRECCPSIFLEDEKGNKYTTVVPELSVETFTSQLKNAKTFHSGTVAFCNIRSDYRYQLHVSCGQITRLPLAPRGTIARTSVNSGASVSVPASLPFTTQGLPPGILEQRLPSGSTVARWQCLDSPDCEKWMYTEFYPSGKRKRQGSIVEKVQEGEWTTWYDGGPIESTGSYANGYKEGTWRGFTKAGLEVPLELYRQGRLVEEARAPQKYAGTVFEPSSRRDNTQQPPKVSSARNARSSSWISMQSDTTITPTTQREQPLLATLVEQEKARRVEATNQRSRERDIAGSPEFAEIRNRVLMVDGRLNQTTASLVTKAVDGAIARGGTAAAVTGVAEELIAGATHLQRELLQIPTAVLEGSMDSAAAMSRIDAIASRFDALASHFRQRLFEK